MDLEKFAEAVQGPLTWYQKALLRNASTGRLILNGPRLQNMPILGSECANEKRALQPLIEIGPRTPKRKRRKRLAKKIKQRGGMLKTRGLVQSYFDAWPAMRGWFT